MDETIDAMEAYAIYRLKSVNLKDFNGQEPIDLIGELILKVVEGKRDWGKAKCGFKEFLFGCLKSDIDSFFRTNNVSHTDQIPDNISTSLPEDLELKKSKLLELLKGEGADLTELDIFECWMDGVTRPAEIALELGLGIKVIYRSIKRLERRLPKIEEQAKIII